MFKTAFMLAVIGATAANEMDLDDYTEVGTVQTDVDDDDDAVRKELHRRDGFDKLHKKALMRLLLRPEAREGDRAWQRKRVATEAVAEIARRMEFDERHPRIYKSKEEERRAYTVFDPASLFEPLERLRVFHPSE